MVRNGNFISGVCLLNNETAQEIENLRREARALKEIRESMGTDDFASKVFNKVFRDDIERLRGMGDMWKSRSPPKPIDFDELQEQSGSVRSTIASADQKTWTTEEDFVVFKDRLVRASDESAYTRKLANV